MAVPTTLHIGRPCMQCTAGRVCGPGGGKACHRAAGWGRRGEGGGRHAHPAGGGGGSQGGEGRGGGAGATVRPHARQHRVGGMATNRVLSAQGGGTLSTHVHASTGWKDWAATPVHISTGWRIRWVSRLRSQPLPRYQSRGYGSAAKPPLWVEGPGSLPLCTTAHGAGGVRGGRGEGHGGLGGRPPGACTPGSGRVEHDLHPAALPPRLHECADREPRPSVGVVPRAGVPVLRGWLGRPRGGRHCVPHGVHPPDGGQHRAGGRERVLGRGEGSVAPEDAPDGAAVGDTHPMAPGALRLVVPPLDQEHPALGSAGPGLRGGGSGAADGEGTQVPEWRQQRGDQGGLRTLLPMEAGGPPERGRRAIPPAKGFVERGARHCQALGNALQGRQPPSGVRARGRPVEEAPHEDVLQAEEAGERPLEGVERAGDAREGPLRARVVGGSARLTWVSQRRRAGAGSLRAIERRVRCS